MMGGTGGIIALFIGEVELEEDMPGEGATKEISKAEQTIWNGVCAYQRTSPTGYTREEENTTAKSGPGCRRIFLEAVHRRRIAKHYALHGRRLKESRSSEESLWNQLQPQ